MRTRSVVLALTGLAFLAGRPQAVARGDEVRPGWDVPDAEDGHPATTGAPIGDSVDPYGHAFWPARVRRLERVEWRSTQGGEVGAALPAPDGLLRVLGGGGGLRAMDPAKGDVRWVVDGNANCFNYSSAALGRGGVAFFANFGFLSAATADGKLLWRTELAADWIHAAPAVSPDGTTVYVGGDALGIAALDAATGTVRWMRRDFRSASTSYAFDGDGRVIAAIGATVKCFEKDGAERWTLKAKLAGLVTVNGVLVGISGNTVQAYELTKRKLQWKADLAAPVSGLALGDDGRLRASLADGALASVELSGQVSWRLPIADCRLARPVTCAGGDAVVVDERGVVRVVDLDGEIVSSLDTGAPPSHWRPTVLADGRVVVNDRDHIVCVGGTERPLPPRPRATQVVVVADDFVVDVWHDGKLVPLTRRHLLAEVFGATSESIDVEVRDGDWLVFHVVANRLRWGAASYFGACALDALRRPAFASTTKGNWSACDDPSEAAAFIAERGAGADRLAVAPAHPWADAPGVWRNVLGRDFPGEPVWGTSASTWIKCVVPRR